MSLVQSLISQDKYSIKCPYTMEPVGICIHNTYNDAPAKNEVSYMKTNSNQVSFHIAIDDIEAIQVIPFNRNAWHAGDGGSGQGNRKYIGIEICYSKSGGDRFIKAEERTAKEVASLLKQFGWGIDKVKKHQDFSNKYCPHRTLDMGWQRFINMIAAELNGSSNNQQPNTIKVGDKVQIEGSNYATGQVIPDWAKKNTYTVDRVENNKALLSDIVSWVYFKDLRVVTSTTTNPTPEPSTQWVLNLQRELNKQGYRDSNGNKLVEDGIAGKRTLEACPILKQGAKGNITRLLQEKLNQFGYTTNGIDGIFGNGTYNAVVAYQRNKGLSADGIVGKATWSKVLGL